MTDSEQQTHSPAANSSVSHDALETPSWLLGPATGGGLPPPVQTLNQLLPLSELSWDDFERLCLSPNPPKDTDGRREGSGRGWVRELQGRWPGVLG